MTGAQRSSGSLAASTSTSPPVESEEMDTLRVPQMLHNPSYGSLGSTSRTSGSRSPKLNTVPEERSSTFIPLENVEEEVEMDLEDQGYFVGEQSGLSLSIALYHNVYLTGSYPRLVRLYAFVPFTAIVTWLLLGIFAPLAFIPRQSHHPHPKFFPSPLPELITSAAFWSFAYQLRAPLFSLVSTATDNLNAAVILHALSHVIVYNLLRLAVLPILGIRDDMESDFPTRSDYAFFRVWWISLGWSFVEVVVAIWQGYEQLALYEDIMISPSRVKEFVRTVVSPEERDYEEIPVTNLASCKCCQNLPNTRSIS